MKIILGSKRKAVVTKAQAKQQAKPIKPLKVIENLGEDVTREKLIALQGQSEFSRVYEGSRKESEGWKGRSVFQDEGWNLVQVLQKL